MQQKLNWSNFDLVICWSSVLVHYVCQSFKLLFHYLIADCSNIKFGNTIAEDNIISRLLAQRWVFMFSINLQSALSAYFQQAMSCVLQIESTVLFFFIVDMHLDYTSQFPMFTWVRAYGWNDDDFIANDSTICANWDDWKDHVRITNESIWCRSKWFGVLKMVQDQCRDDHFVMLWWCSLISLVGSSLWLSSVSTSTSSSSSSSSSSCGLLWQIIKGSVWSRLLATLGHV